MLKNKLIICVMSLLLNLAYASCDKYQNVFKLMQQRATLLKDVAANKYVSKSSPYDTKQELSVLTNVSQLADNLNLEKYSLLSFAQIQMDLSKQIEQFWLNSWQKSPESFPKKYLDLATIREQIKLIDQQIYPGLKLALTNPNSCSEAQMQTQFNSIFTTQLDGIPSTPDYAKIMVNSIFNLKLAN